MSITIPFPFVVMVLGAAYWPASLLIIVATVGTGVTFRGAWRVALFIVGGLVAANMALGFLLIAGG